MKRLNGTEKFKGTDGKEYNYGDKVRFHYYAPKIGECIVETKLDCSIAVCMLRKKSLFLLNDNNKYDDYIYFDSPYLFNILETSIKLGISNPHVDELFSAYPSSFTVIASKILAIALDSTEEGHISECKTLYTINPNTGIIEKVKPNAYLYLNNTGYFRSEIDAKLALEVMSEYAYYDYKKTKRKYK